MLSIQPDTLTGPCIEVLQGSHNVEIPPASKRAAVDRCYDDRDPVRHDFRVDGEQKHQ